MRIWKELWLFLKFSGPTLLKAKEDSIATMLEIKFNNLVVETLIENYELIFKSPLGRGTNDKWVFKFTFLPPMLTFYYSPQKNKISPQKPFNSPSNNHDTSASKPRFLQLIRVSYLHLFILFISLAVAVFFAVQYSWEW